MTEDDYAWLERAAIMEYEAGLSRRDAEGLATKERAHAEYLVEAAKPPRTEARQKARAELGKILGRRHGTD